MFPSVPVVPVSGVFTITVAAAPAYLLETGVDVARYHAIMCLVVPDPDIRINPGSRSDGGVMVVKPSSAIMTEYVFLPCRHTPSDFS